MLYPEKDAPISTLKIGDIVQLWGGPFGTAIVSRVDEGQVYFYRPYAHADLDCRYSGNRIICFMGLEEFTRPITDNSTVLLFRRAEEKDFEIALKQANAA